MTVIDVHTHMLSEEWLALLERHGMIYTVHEISGGGAGRCIARAHRS